MDEFAEARWLQRWGAMDRLLHFALIAVATAALAVFVWQEWKGGKA